MIAFMHIRDKFWITLVLSIPTLLWSGMVQHMFGSSAPTFPGSEYVPALFGCAVYFYGGLVFVKGGLQELRDRKPGMMTLSPWRAPRRSSSAWR
jgi:Cu2+-exporting ATPase